MWRQTIPCLFALTVCLVRIHADSPTPICLSDCVLETVIGPSIGLVFILSVCCLVVFLSRQTESAENEMEFSKRNPERRVEEQPAHPFSPMSQVEHSDPESRFHSPESIPESIIRNDETPGGPLPAPVWPIRHVLQDGRPASGHIATDTRSLYSSLQSADQLYEIQDKTYSLSMHHEHLESFGIA